MSKNMFKNMFKTNLKCTKTCSKLEHVQKMFKTEKFQKKISKNRKNCDMLKTCSKIKHVEKWNISKNMLKLGHG